MATSGNADDICITGMSGRLPESSNLQEFKDNLFNHVDMVTADDRRWPPGTCLFLPQICGGLLTIEQ